MSTKVLFIETDPLRAKGLIHLAGEVVEIQMLSPVITDCNEEKIIEAIQGMARTKQPDIFLLGPEPGLSNDGILKCIQRAREAIPEIKIITILPDAKLNLLDRLIKAGVKGFFPAEVKIEKFEIGLAEFIREGVYMHPRIIEIILKGIKEDDRFFSDKSTRLTLREMEALKLMAQGKTNVEIAEALVISPRTAEIHVRNIMRKLNVTNRIEAINHALDNGILLRNQLNA